MVFTYTDAVALTALYVFVHWQTSGGSGGASSSRRSFGWYASGIAQIRARPLGCAPPGWLFGIAWWLLYKLITAALFIFYRESPDAKWTFLGVFVTASVNILLNKRWSELFWDWGSTGWSLVVAILMFISSVVVLVFVALTPENALWGLVFGLYMPYAVWLVVAIYLNAWWYALDLPTTTTTTADALPTATRPGGVASRHPLIRHR